MCASDCDISWMVAAVPGSGPLEPRAVSELAPLRRRRSAVGIDLARPRGVALGGAALGVGRLRLALGLPREALRLGLELVGAVVAALGLGTAGAGLDATLALGARPLAAGRHGEQGDQQDDDGDDDDDQDGAHAGPPRCGWRGVPGSPLHRACPGRVAPFGRARTEGNGMPLDIETALEWRGRTVVDRDGDKIGKFDELYLDDADRPAWAAVTTGLFGMRQTFVPLSEARADGDVLQVPFDKDTVKDAPSVDPDAQLSPEEEDLLHRHYGLAGGAGRGDDAAVERDAPVMERDAPVMERDAPVAEREAGVVERDAPVEERPAAGDEDVHDETVAPADSRTEAEGGEMVRSEEEVSVGTRRRVAGKARLKKYVVTEHVQKVVPVQREEVRVEFEPSEDEGGRAPDSTREVAEPETGDAPVREP